MITTALLTVALLTAAPRSEPNDSLVRVGTQYSVRQDTLDNVVKLAALPEKPTTEPVLSKSASVCTPGQPCLAMAGTDTPPAPATNTVPADLLQAMQTVEADRVLLATSNSAVAAATVALQNANKQVSDTTVSFSKDKAALQTLINRYYPPDPTPTPVVPPVNPDVPTPPVVNPDVPTPPPANVVTLTLISANPATITNCPACKSVESESVPTLKQQLGSSFTETLDSSSADKAGFPPATIGANSVDGGTCVPRWVLTRNGKVEKRVGYMSTQALTSWIAGK